LSIGRNWSQRPSRAGFFGIHVVVPISRCNARYRQRAQQAECRNLFPQTPPQTNRPPRKPTGTSPHAFHLSYRSGGRSAVPWSPTRPKQLTRAPASRSIPRVGDDVPLPNPLINFSSTPGRHVHLQHTRHTVNVRNFTPSHFIWYIEFHGWRFTLTNVAC